MLLKHIYNLRRFCRKLFRFSVVSVLRNWQHVDIVLNSFAGKGKPAAASVDEGEFHTEAETSVIDQEIKLAAEIPVDEGEYRLATSVDEGEFIDKALDIILDGPVEDSVGSLVKDLDSSSDPTILKGLDGLLYICTKTTLGRLEVFRAGAIRALIKLVQTSNPACSKGAVRISHVSFLVLTESFDMQVWIVYQIN